MKIAAQNRPRTHAIPLLGLIAGLALSGAVYAQASMRADDEKQRKKATLPAPPTPHKPKPVTREREFTRPPYRPHTERDYEPWRTQRNTTPAPRPSATPAPRTQPAKSTAKPAEARDPALARCDELKRRMEQLVREEGFGGDAAHRQRIAEQKRALYQEELRYGCI